MDLKHDAVVAFSKSWGLFYLIALTLGVLVYTFWPSNRKRFDRAKHSILDRDDKPWQVNERDPVSGRETTGHEWNGIKELDTPVPRGVLIFLIVTHVWAIAWWFFVPAWPLGRLTPRAFLGSTRSRRSRPSLSKAQHRRAGWMNRIETEDYDAILADEGLMQTVRSTGRHLFGDNCAACHGRDGKGRRTTPTLPMTIGYGAEAPSSSSRRCVSESTRRHPESRVVQMPAFGHEEMLDQDQVRKRGRICLLFDQPCLLDAG